MNFGMAYWNIDFANEWLQKIIDSQNITDYNNTNYSKGQFTRLPELFEKSGEPISELAKQRIAMLIERGFVDKIDNIDEGNIGNEMYFVCYGSFDLYYSPERDGPGHPPNAILYREYVDLKSVNYLQTLPTNNDILVYDYSGQLSAAVVAYLQLMGYHVNSFLFGGNGLPYLQSDGYIYEFICFYSRSRFSNFPYVTGK